MSVVPFHERVRRFFQSRVTRLVEERWKADGSARHILKVGRGERHVDQDGSVIVLKDSAGFVLARYRMYVSVQLFRL